MSECGISVVLGRAALVPAPRAKPYTAWPGNCLMCACKYFAPRVHSLSSIFIENHDLSPGYLKKHIKTKNFSWVASQVAPTRHKFLDYSDFIKIPVGIVITSWPLVSPRYLGNNFGRVNTLGAPQAASHWKRPGSFLLWHWEAGASRQAVCLPCCRVACLVPRLLAPRVVHRAAVPLPRA
ncbi:hypothetical protein HAX54_006146, partial [Datura stramonium]|nr:hypothetical protein [Datura stramonium]